MSRHLVLLTLVTLAVGCTVSNQTSITAASAPKTGSVTMATCQNPKVEGSDPGIAPTLTLKVRFESGKAFLWYAIDEKASRTILLSAARDHASPTVSTEGQKKQIKLDIKASAQKETSYAAPLPQKGTYKLVSLEISFDAQSVSKKPKGTLVYSFLAGAAGSQTNTVLYQDCVFSQPGLLPQ